MAPMAAASVRRKLLLDDSATEETASATTTSRSTDDNNNNRQKHIEVCARLRPLQISMQSSASYFHGTNCGGRDSHIAQPTSPRKPPIPSSRIGMGSHQKPPRSSHLLKPQNVQIKKPPPPEPELFYAWDVTDDAATTLAQSTHTEIVQGRTHQYTLDKVYGPSMTTADVYDQSVQNLVHAAMEGYHTSVLAYGQTSTGKTFSMTGTPSSPGIIPLAIKDCFSSINSDREYLIRVSYLEIYKEQIRDLLVEGPSQIRLFDHPEQGLIVKGLREEVVTCPKRVFEILAQGESRRKVGATNMNHHSSRSHVMVRLWIESRATATTTTSTNHHHQQQPVRVSSLSLVDLAGSESVRLHGSDEVRRQEGHYINKSLMALGKVVYALSEQGKMEANNNNNSKTTTNNKQFHIPYRDSKLTRILQPSLSGNAQMVLICCVSPLATHLEESHNTLKFATRAKKIPQKATIHESEDEKTLLQAYRDEIDQLKQQLKEAKGQQEKLLLTQQQQKEQQASSNDTTTNTSNEANDEEDDIEDEVEELKQAIRAMEHLIVKSKATSPPSVARRTLSEDELVDGHYSDDDEDDEQALLALLSETEKSSGNNNNNNQAPPVTPPRTPLQSTDDMQSELHRIQGLLGSVLKRRSKQSNGSSPTKSSSEVVKLRKELEQQEVATSLRKADSSFLQQQLDQKDDLLQEVSKILEAVEQRQTELEAENTALKKELADLKAKHSSNNNMKNGVSAKFSGMDISEKSC